MAQIEVINVENNNAGKYQQVVLAYKNAQGAVKSYRHVSFNKPEIFASIRDAVAGQVYNVEWGKNDKGYPEMNSFVQGKKSEDAPDKGSSGYSSKPDPRETKEERAARQLLIVRQSSLSNALQYFEITKGKPSIEDVYNLADQMVEFIFADRPAEVE